MSTSVPVAEATEGDARAQVAGLVAPDGEATVQLRLTVAVNVPSGATVTVDVLPVVAPAVRLSVVGLGVREKLEEPDAEPLTTACTLTVWTYLPVESVPVTSTLYDRLAVAAGALMVSVALVLEPLLNDSETGIEQVIPAAAVQVRLTAPEKPLFEVRVMGIVPLAAPPLTLSGSRVVFGTMPKSESGLEMVTSAVEGASVELPPYCSVS